MRLCPSKPSHLASATSPWMLCGALLLAGGCGGSSGGGGTSQVGPQFILQEVSVSSGQSWQINRAIEFSFSRAVDFDSVNANTLNVSEVAGGPAIGE